MPVVWQYHINTEPEAIGHHFLAFNAGYVSAVALAQRWLLRFALRSIALYACGLASVCLTALALLSPPIPVAWRLVDMGLLGFAGGLLTAALLHILELFFARSMAKAANRAGLFFGLGSLLASVVIGCAYLAGTVRWETVFLATVPLLFLFLLARSKYPVALGPRSNHKNTAHANRNPGGLRTVAAFLFSVLLFFQFGNEWAIAGWLPIFLIHRLGSNPVWAIFASGAYFLALIIGRLLSQSLLARVSHRKLLAVSVSLSMAACLGLSFAATITGALVAATVVGFAFAPIYPLLAETLDKRFSYQPGFYNGIFSVAITGAMCAPWLLGYVDAYLGIEYVMVLPGIGSIIVFVLALLLMFEARLMRSGTDLPVTKLISAAAGK